MFDPIVHNIDDYWTGLSAIIVASITFIFGPYILARYQLKRKGITPQEAAHATNRVQFRHKIDESVRLAVEIAHEAQETAARAELRLVTLQAENNRLAAENATLQGRVALLEAAYARIEILEAETKRCQNTLRLLRKRGK